MKKRILIIDDEPSLLNSMKRDLRGEKDKYDVITSSNSKDIFKLIDDNGIDLLITDIYMPEKEGIEIITEVRIQYPSLKIIAMSGGGVIESNTCMDIALKLGATGCLYKPFTREELLKALESIW
jgi:YesN/AraC family two-component response regulator